MTPGTLASLSGWLYLAASVCFIVAGLIRSRIIEPPGTAPTIDTFRASAGPVRLGLMIDLASVLLFLLTALALYALFADVNQFAAATMVIFVVVGVPVGLLAVASELAALTIVTGAGGLSDGEHLARDSAIAVLATLQTSARVVNDLVAGLWLLPLGYLVWVSGLFPRVIGALLLVAGLSWLIRLGVVVVMPQLARVASFVVLGAIGEVVFIIWLIVRGAPAP